MPCEVFWVSRASSVISQFHFKVWIARGGHRKGHVKGELVRNMEGNPNCVTAEGRLMLLVLLTDGFSF